MAKIIDSLRCKFKNVHDHKVIGIVTPSGSIHPYNVLLCKSCSHLKWEQLDNILVYPILKESKVEYKTANKKEMAKVDTMKSILEDAGEDLWV